MEKCIHAANTLRGNHLRVLQRRAVLAKCKDLIGRNQKTRQARVDPLHTAYAATLDAPMFWLIWKKFVGSYFFFSFTRRP